MEDSSYSSLKQSLSSVPAKALNYSSRLKLSGNLNVKIVLPAKSGNARDYRGLAELMGFQYNDIKKFERHEDPTIKILESWETQPNAMLDKLIDYLQEMERHDVIKELLPLLERDVETYLKRQKLQEIPIQVPEVTSCPVNENHMHSENHMQLFTRDDIRNGECTYYDAYVSYADADIGDVRLLANYLESPDIGLKLFIRSRDMLAGCAELDTNIELIKNRCRRMLIILTPNYLKSPACKFQTSFAASLAIDQTKRMLIPVILEPCEIPSILKFVSKIDFTKPGNNWVYEKLINSLLPKHRSPMFLSTPEKSSRQRLTPPKLGSSISFENNPAITFPSSIKQLSDSVDNSVAEVSFITSNSENAPKDSPAVPSKTKKWKLQLYSHLKKARISSSGYSSSSSASSRATSGFHSQSNNTLDNFESLVEGSTNDTPL